MNLINKITSENKFATPTNIDILEIANKINEIIDIINELIIVDSTYIKNPRYGKDSSLNH